MNEGWEARRLPNSQHVQVLLVRGLRVMSATQPNLANLEFLSFGGKNGENVTSFLQNVARIAFLQSKQADDAWLLSYVETCLTGQALRWFCGLEDEAIESWRSLRRAFLRDFLDSLTPGAPPAAAAAPPRRRASVSSASEYPLASELGGHGFVHESVSFPSSGCYLCMITD